MKKFEYYVASIYTFDQNRFGYPNPTEIKQGLNFVEQRLNDLGQNGWELCAMARTALIFKRQIRPSNKPRLTPFSKP